MPQKKNPDGLELIRGKTGRISGHLVGFLMVLKGLPSTYNKDIQEDKEAVFDAYDTLAASLEVAVGNMETMKVCKAACESALSPDMLATDVAYYLVRKGKNLAMTSLTCSDAKSVSDLFDDDLAQLWNYEHSVEQYKATGGTAKASVLAQIASLRQWLTEVKERR
ncbi:hypothetical protein HPB52_017038 [Rhipicephalus sanguineus]|uniref:Argininosuccinate lyase n=1 Tax=Rhipicephalus sanguineus TaxID=34632 RepID=A0A9D4SXM4_RHISA|nr:hypothetical protein HPB52_017038 [Rhipicephalus sanguineus]